MAGNDLSEDTDFERQNEQAVRAARDADGFEPRARAVRYDRDRALLIVELRSGFAFGFPPRSVPGLGQATADQLEQVRISASGDGLYWDDVDAHASLTGLVTQALNLREWAPRILGQAKSEAKARAARANGRKGGRPRRTDRTAEPEKG